MGLVKGTTRDGMGGFSPAPQHLAPFLSMSLPHAPLLTRAVLLQTPLWGWHDSLSHITDGGGEPLRHRGSPQSCTASRWPGPTRVCSQTIGSFFLPRSWDLPKLGLSLGPRRPPRAASQTSRQNRGRASTQEPADAFPPPPFALTSHGSPPRSGSPAPSSSSPWTGSTRLGTTSSRIPRCCGPTTMPCPTSPWAAGGWHAGLCSPGPQTPGGGQKEGSRHVGVTSGCRGG